MTIPCSTCGLDARYCSCSRCVTASDDRRPLPPDILASALTDRVHQDIGRGRPAVVSRVAVNTWNTDLETARLAGFRAGMNRAAEIVAATSWPGTTKARQWAAAVSAQIRAMAPTEKE